MNALLRVRPLTFTEVLLDGQQPIFEAETPIGIYSYQRNSHREIHCLAGNDLIAVCADPITAQLRCNVHFTDRIRNCLEIAE